METLLLVFVLGVPPQAPPVKKCPPQAPPVRVVAEVQPTVVTTTFTQTYTQQCTGPNCPQQPIESRGPIRRFLFR